MSNSSNTLSLLFLLLSFVHGTPHSIKSSSSLIKSSCTTTLYPNICFSTLSDNTPKLATKTDVIELAINKTRELIKRNLNTINNITATTNLTKRAKIAFSDCLELGDGTLHRLDMVIQDLRANPTNNSNHQHIDNLLTFMSTTITNTETCLDGFSHDAPCKLLRKLINKGQEDGGKMCSNALAMIKKMTNTNMSKEAEFKEKDKEKVTMWPDWLSARDRKLLQSVEVTPNVTVASDGTGDYSSVVEAVEAAPSKSVSRYVIKIKAGVYMENVAIPRSKTNLMFIGEGRSKTVITESLSVAGGTTTFNSATVAAVGDGFLARDITFQNTAGPSGNQAVALRVGSDLSAFYRCDMLAYQDTLYVHSNRQFYIECMVQGTVDFIFGNAAAVFQNSDIQARVPNPEQKNMVTAQGRTDPNQNTGIVIQKCTIGATSDLQPVQASFPTYLGRPWKLYSRTVVMQSSISDVINPAGWYHWNGDFALDTLYYREYQNTGPGADTSNRVTWKGWGVITNATEAVTFTSGTFIGGGNWLPSTGFPFSLGL